MDKLFEYYDAARESGVPRSTFSNNERTVLELNKYRITALGLSMRDLSDRGQRFHAPIIGIPSLIRLRSRRIEVAVHGDNPLLNVEVEPLAQRLQRVHAYGQELRESLGLPNITATIGSVAEYAELLYRSRQEGWSILDDIEGYRSLMSATAVSGRFKRNRKEIFAHMLMNVGEERSGRIIFGMRQLNANQGRQVGLLPLIMPIN